MKVKILFNGSKLRIPLSLKYSIASSYVNKCLEGKDYHGKNKYTTTPLLGGKIENNFQLNIENGTYIIFTTNDDKIMSEFIVGTLKNKMLFNDIKFSDIIEILEKQMDGYNYFTTLSPILLKKSDGKNYDFITFDNKNYLDILKENTITRLKKVNPDLDLTNFDLEIIDDKFKKNQKIYIQKDKGFVKNIGVNCNIKITSTKDVAEIISNIGLGQSTGYGFGCVFNSKYRNSFI